MGERLQKFLARAGVASRRGAEALVRSGRVRVGSRVTTDPASPVEAGDVVCVDGREVRPAGRRTYALHKPGGYVSTARDPQGRPTVLDLGPRDAGRLYPVGRLDAQSEGLLLLTNDGDLCQALTHPRHGVPKTYRVLCDPVPADGQLERLARGVRLADGPTRPAGVRRLSGAWIELVLREGRNRQVRRMCAAVGLDVRRLVRVAIGDLRLDGLPPGRWRALDEGEVERLRRLAAVPEPQGPRWGGGSGSGAAATGSGGRGPEGRSGPRRGGRTGGDGAG
jgi:23S rRNA pseudouridine2605 synthase